MDATPPQTPPPVEPEMEAEGASASRAIESIIRSVESQLSERTDEQTDGRYRRHTYLATISIKHRITTADNAMTSMNQIEVLRGVRGNPVVKYD